MRRGWPSMRTLKSAGVRFEIGRPRSSTTVASSDVTSTEAWKLGFGGCGWAWATAVRSPAATTKPRKRDGPISAFTFVRSLARKSTVALARTDLAMSVDVHFDPPPLIVALRVGRLIAEQVLVRELVEEIGKRVVQLLDVLGEQRAPAGGRRHPLHDAPQRLHRDAAALPDHIERHVARLQAPLDVLDRGVASLILAVGEDDERLAAGLAAEDLDPAQDDVVQRR